MRFGNEDASLRRRVAFFRREAAFGGERSERWRRWDDASERFKEEKIK